MIRLLRHLVGTFFGVGHIPVIPATWTSLVVALLLYGLQLESLSLQLALLLAFTVSGVWACHGLETEYGEDPRQATMDEAAGMLLTVLGLPPSAAILGLGFALFRILDVLKPWPARKLESLRGGWGIMADDLMAGIYGRLLMALILWRWPGLAP